MDPSERPATSDPNGPASGSYEPRSEVDPNPAPSKRAVERSVSETTRFRVVALHASGGMGNVFVAKDDQLHRSVALKEIQATIRRRSADPRSVPPRGGGDGAARAPRHRPRLRDGALRRRSAVLRHADDPRRQPEARDRRVESLREQGDEHAYRLELRRLLNRFVTACNTIEYAHSRGVVHRDIKPDNIMLGPYGETLVVDWGLAKVIGSSDMQTDVADDESVIQSPSDATQFGTVTGTPAYMSPEQALGWQDAIKPASDVYSLGATLYSLLTGRPPLGGDDLGHLLVRIQKQDFRKPREINSSIPRPLEAICLKAMARSVSARYSTAVGARDRYRRPFSPVSRCPPGKSHFRCGPHGGSADIARS